MRILHVAEAFGAGLMQMVVELAEGGVVAGDDVCIAYGIRPETPTTLRADIQAAVELQPMPWTSRRPGPQFAAARRLRALVDEWHPDLVHLHSSFSGVIGAIVVPRGIPTIYSPHAFASAVPEGSAARRAGYQLLERLACRRVTLVGAVSDSEAELARAFGARDVVVVPNGISELDPARVVTRDRRDTDGPASVLAMGRTVAQRQPAAAGRILAAVRDLADVEWLGGGGGRRGVDGFQALKELGIEPTGWLARDEVLERLGDATAYLHWTAWDGLPLSVLEALALDVLVIASDIPPNRDILGDAGVCTTEAEAVALIRTVLTDPGAAASLRQRQRERREQFGAAAMVERWRQTYESLVAPGAKVSVG